MSFGSGYFNTVTSINQIGDATPGPGFPIPICMSTRCFAACDTRWQGFRPNVDVDILGFDSSSYRVGWITAGEYLRYTVDVTENGRGSKTTDLRFSAIIDHEKCCNIERVILVYVYDKNAT